MRKRHMLLAVILMLALAFAFSPGTYAKKKAPKLNKKKASLNVGKSLTLKVKNTKKKVTWKSSNKSVATVSKKGVVKAKKVGKATITAKVAGKSLKCKITVKKQKVKPVSQKLKYKGRMPFEDKITSGQVGFYDKDQLDALGIKSVADQYYFDGRVYADAKVTIKSASVTAKTTGTKIGSYKGTTRYDIQMTGTIEAPARGYVKKYNYGYTDPEKVEVDIPADAESQRNFKAFKDELQSKLCVDVSYMSQRTEYRGDDGDINCYALRNLGDTDEAFDGYVSAFNCDEAGNFTYRVYDVSLFEIWDYFNISNVHFK